MTLPRPLLTALAYPPFRSVSFLLIWFFSVWLSTSLYELYYNVQVFLSEGTEGGSLCVAV